MKDRILKELQEAAQRSALQYREDKVQHLLWYLIDSRDDDNQAALERAIGLAVELRLTDRLIKGAE